MAVAVCSSHAAAPPNGSKHAAAPPPLARAIAPAVTAVVAKPTHPTATAAPSLPSAQGHLTPVPTFSAAQLESSRAP